MVGVTVIVPEPLSSTEVTTPDAPASVPQVMLPLMSVSRTDAVLQFNTVPILRPPAVMRSPLPKVEEAVPVVLRAKALKPAEKVDVELEPETLMKPANVDVAVVDVALKYGAPIFVPDSIPPPNVEVAVPDAIS